MKFKRALAAIVAATALALIPAVPSQALTYTYLVGHPMYFPGGSCTGGYTIVGSSGMFTMTAGHCGSVGNVVRGTDAPFASVSYKKPTTRGDSLLTTVYAGVTQLQIIVDPRTGSSPGSNGKVTGVMPSSQQTSGTLVGKMGITTGWTEGTVYGTIPWYGRTAICSTAQTRPGDSGGPVWRADQYGLRAVGMTVAYFESTGYGCYLPMDQLLAEWGATLPTFPGGALAPASAGTAAIADLPELDTTGLVPAMG